jgi:hypothetical protein
MEKSEDQENDLYAAMEAFNAKNLEENNAFFQDYYICLLGGKATILSKTDQTIMMDRRSASDLWENKRLVQSKIMRNKKGGNTYIEYDDSAFDAWFSSTNERYYGLLYDPELPQGSVGLRGKKYWNNWKGWAYDPDENGNCDLYLKHIFENICSENEDAFEYILDYLAIIVQNPKLKIGHALVLKSTQGTGKGEFVYHFMRLFGDSAIEINDAGILTREFNGILANKLLIYADESFFSGDIKSWGALKNVLTSQQLTIRYLYKEGIKTENYLHCIFSTNNDYSFPVEIGNRRAVCIKVGVGHRNDRAYFAAIREQLDNCNGYGKLLYILQNREIKRDWSITPAFDDSNQVNLMYSLLVQNPTILWLKDAIEDNLPSGCNNPFREKDGFMKNMAAYESFDAWNEKMKNHKKLSFYHFSRSLSEYTGKGRKRRDGVPVRGYDFSDIKGIKKQIEHDFNCKIDISWREEKPIEYVEKVEEQHEYTDSEIEEYTNKLFSDLGIKQLADD